MKRVDLWERFHEQPCWHCTKYFICSWGHDLEPVKGWDAEPVEKSSTAQSSYKIHDCPLFEYDNYVPTPAPSVKPTRRTFAGGQWATGFYLYSLTQKKSRVARAKVYATGRLYQARPPIPYSLVADYIQHNGLSPTNAAMLFTGRLIPETLRSYRRKGEVPGSSVHYDRIAEIIGWDATEHDDNLNSIGGCRGFLRLSGAEQEDAKS